MNINSKIQLNNGINIPILGLGTYLSNPGKETQAAVEYALETGYRHIDTAAFYKNEEDVGNAVRNSGIPRSEIFVTTKLWNSEQGFDKALRAFDNSLKKLKLDYVDLYLIHWPIPKLRIDSWRALERIYQQGYCKSIGVSNYMQRHIEELISFAAILPSVNQIEFSPYLYLKELQDFCRDCSIYIQAYTPLVRGKKKDDPRLLSIAKKYNKSWAQILIRWALQVGTIVLPKSVHKERIHENADIFDFEISEKDMDEIKSFHYNYRITWDPTNIE
jgi:methylglyoxal/glyoxal reductase